jgi:cystathionine beta-lyase
MAKMLNFSTHIDRKNSNCVKYGLLRQRFGKDDVLPLWVADMDFSAPKGVVKALKKRASHPIYGYSIYPKSYFNAVKKHMKSYAFAVKTKEIIPVPSVVSAINIALQTFCKAGDGVIIQTPIYPPFLSSVKNNSLELLQNGLVKDKDFAIDFEDFETKAKRAKAFIFCNPHNPCGRVFDKETVKRVADICVRNDILIISDEVHADIVFENRVHTPIALFAPKHTITLNSPSKTYSLTGLSSAYAIIQSERLKRKFVLALTKLGFHGANPFSIEATVAALNDTHYKKRLLRYLQANLDYLTYELQQIKKLDVIKPQGTFLLWIDCKKLGLNDARLKEYFVDKLGLALNSGIDFGEEGSGYMRLNFATPRKNLKKAVKALKKI